MREGKLKMWSGEKVRARFPRFESALMLAHVHLKVNKFLMSATTTARARAGRDSILSPQDDLQ
jgi:hypothetical protein